MKPIQLFVPTFRVDETLSEIRLCLEKGWTGLGFKTIEFEENWKKYTGFSCAHFLDSATAGLHLAVKLLKIQNGWQDGDEIITTPLTFVSSNHAILYENLKPVFADVDEYLCLDPSSVLQKITEKTKAVMFVGLGGNPGQLEAIQKICREHKLKLILDAAHMAGTKLNGKQVGSDADVVVFSFQAVKNLPTADSGMICFKEVELDQEVRKWSWLGINKDTYSRTVSSAGNYKWYYDVEYVGHKYHGNSIMAAMGLVSLKYLDEDNNRRRKLAELYDNYFENQTKIKPVRMAPGFEPSRHLYQILVPMRDDLLSYLNTKEIYPGVHYRDNTVYRMYDYADGTCPNARYASQHVISLPMHINLTDSEVKYVSEMILSYFNEQ